MIVSKKLWFLIAIGAVLVSGCQSDKASLYPAAKPPSQGDTTPDKPVAAKKVAPVMELSGELAKMPESLKTDALYYYGLTNDQPIQMKVTQNGKETSTSTTSVRVIQVAEDHVTFAIDRTGALADLLGSQELVLNKDGLFTTKLNGKARGKPSLELPLELTTGKSWNSDETIDAPQGKLRMITRLQVVKKEKIKTDVGEFDALRLDMTGSMTLGGQKSSSTASLWMVKGLGLVKLTGTSTDAKGKVEKMTMEIEQPS